MAVHPLFHEAICICLASDDLYAKYLDVTLISIKENRNPSDKYDICILDNGISAVHRQQLFRLSEESFSIRFINVAGVFDIHNDTTFTLNEHAHYTQTAYARLFIADIFYEYRKILYLDVDIILLTDVATLYNTDLNSHALAAARDVGVLFFFEKEKKCNGFLPDYLIKTLKLTTPSAYFQSGVILFDIQKLHQIDFTKKYKEELRRIEKPIWVDQCVLNSVFNGDYKILDQRWNVLWHMAYLHNDLDKQWDAVTYTDHMNARQHPFIIHYAGPKPWIQPEVALADKWWHYARQSVFYEQFVADIHQKEIRQLKGELDASNLELRQLKQEHDILRGEFVESKRYVKRIVKALVPDKAKPHIKAVLSRIPHKIKAPVKRLLRW